MVPAQSSVQVIPAGNGLTTSTGVPAIVPLPSTVTGRVPGQGGNGSLVVQTSATRPLHAGASMQHTASRPPNAGISANPPVTHANHITATHRFPVQTSSVPISVRAPAVGVLPQSAPVYTNLMLQQHPAAPNQQLPNRQFMQAVFSPVFACFPLRHPRC